MAPLLREHDESGNRFTLHGAESYLEEDEYSRLARDVVFFTASNKFLVKKWRERQARAQFANAFSTFLYRPPKHVPATAVDLKSTAPMWEVEVKGWLLTYAVDGLGPANNEELASLFGPEAKDALLNKALTSEVRCDVMPSWNQSGTSSISAPMTVLTSCVQCDEIDLSKFPDFEWAGLWDAMNPDFNAHAGVIANFCLEKGLVSAQLLDEFGWTEDERLVTVKLPAALSKFRSWGTDVASIYTSMKGLLIEEHRRGGRLPAPLPPRGLWIEED